MASYKLVAVIKNSSDDDFLVVRQERPPPLPEVEYQQFVDTDLWDLPSALLKPIEGERIPEILIQGAESISGKVDLGDLDIGAGLDQIVSQLGVMTGAIEDWEFLKFVEEPDFGPGVPVHTLFVLATLDTKAATLPDLVAALPRKLVVFVTHHHTDHIEGLSVVQKCNPDSILLAHENTMNRIGKGMWSLGYTTISGGEKICIGGQILEALYAPGHTDGHLALLHASTSSLIVGDHCVGQGSTILDATAGGNMKDYFLTTYKFLELSPHVLIPMHGRISLWPKRMLCGYLKNRRARELSILDAIKNGAQTVFDITAKVYGDVDTKLWMLASFNVRIHVDHLAFQEKLPKEFSVEEFYGSCDDFLGKLSSDRTMGRL